MIQRERNTDGKLNSETDIRHLATTLDPNTQELFDKLIINLGLSAHSYSKIIRIARTIADLEERENITELDMAEAASFRFLDKHLK